MKDRVLLFNDLPGYGKVALTGMMPVLTHMGYRVFNIPTAIISNTLNYGKFELLDTTDYMIHTVDVWKEHGFEYDAVSTGFIANHRQAEFLTDFCKSQSQKGSLIFCDPIMADHGKLYNSITDQNVDDLRNLIQYADYCVPNYTEAVFLTESVYSADGLTEKEMYSLIDRVRTLGPKSVVITSAMVDGRDVLAGYDAIKEEYFIVDYKRIPINIPGAGDLFLAVLMGEVLKTFFLEDSLIQPLKISVEKASEILYQLIDKNKDNQDYFKGIMIERDLNLF